MGLIDSGLAALFGPGGNVIRDTAEVFRENAEAASAREADLRMAALAQFSGEFAGGGRGRFDRVVDGLNRLPRPAMAFGTLGLLASAMSHPDWFAARMAGLALVPEPLWWLLGAVVSFYFGARHQTKGQEFQRALAASLATSARTGATKPPPPAAVPAAAPVDADDNAALAEWRALRAARPA